MKTINYDTHAHIDLYNDINKYLNYIDMKRIYTLIVTNIPELYKKYIKDYGNYKYSKFALGLHPQLVLQYKSQLEIFNELVETSHYIGEVGLDFSKGIDKDQIKVFKEIIESCEFYGGKIITIHSRRAVKSILDIVGESVDNKIILHWFTGNMGELERAIRLNYYFSINTNMLNTNKGREILKRIPLDRLLIESDAPFTKVTKKNYNLDFINLIIKNTSIILNKSISEVKEIYANNFLNLLKT